MGAGGLSKKEEGNVGRGPGQAREPSSIALQGHNRLPNGREVTVRVMRASLPGQTLLMLMLVMAAFLAGVWSGTSGQYREFVVWVTASPPEESLLRSVLMAPDLSERPLIVDSVNGLEHQMALDMSAMRAGLESLRVAYVAQTEQMIQLRRDVPATREACDAADTAANGAWTSSFAAFGRYEKLETTFFGALQACMAALDAASPAPPAVQADPLPAAQSRPEPADVTE